MLEDDVAREVGERIDQLLSIDLPDREVIDIVYPLFRQHYEAPLTYLAAKALTDVRAGQLVLIATGWPNRPYIDTGIAESDGPLGAAVLARAVHLGLRAAPVILIEEQLIPSMARILHANGLRVIDLEAAKRCTNPSVIQDGVAILASPVNLAAAESQANWLIEQENVGAFIAIEKGAANPEGNICFSRGRVCTASTGKIDPLVKLCRSKGILSIGIGDGGNEMGMGNAGGILRKHLTYGDAKYSGGIVPAQQTDIVVPVTVSNWGGYGIAAMLAAMLGRNDLIQDENTERRMLLAASFEGLIDGVTGTTMATSDGLSEEIHVSIVTLLRALIGANIPVSDWPGNAGKTA